MYNDSGTDTIFQYYPYYVNEILSIRDGSFSVWNWNCELGTSIFAFTSWTFDPYAIGLVLLGIILGVGSVQYLLVWMQIAKIITVFALGKKFLGYYLKDAMAINLGAYLLALNGYLLLWGQHYFMGTACVFMLLIFCALENFIRNRCRKGGVWIALSVAGTLIYSYYFGYMILIVAAIYFLYRYFTVIGCGKIFLTIKNLGMCVVSVLSGVMLSGAIFVPACYNVVTSSSRLNGAVSNIGDRIWQAFWSSFNFTNIRSIFSRLLSNNLLYTSANGNYYEAPQLFCTIFIFFFLGQWMVYEVHRAKVCHTWKSLVIKFVLLCLLIFNSATGLIMNGFAYVAYRYTFLVFPFLSICVGVVWQEVLSKGKLDFWGLEIGTVLTLLGWGYSYTHCGDGVYKYVKLVFVLLFIGRFLLMLAYRSNHRQILDCFVALVVITTMLDSAVTTNYRSVVIKENYSLEWKDGQLAGDTADAVSWIKNNDTSFYRVEKTYNEWSQTSDSWFEEISTISGYNSIRNSNLDEFYNNIYTGGATSMASIKYFVLNTPVDRMATNLVNTKYILSEYQLDDTSWQLVNRIGTVYIYRNMQTDSVAKWYGKSISKEQFSTLSEDDKALVLEDTVVLDNEVELAENTDATIGDFSLDSQTELAGQVDCSGQGILMIAIPDQEGWEIYVDGIKAEKYNCDYGFIGVELEEGQHSISVIYHVPMEKEGIVISLIGVLAILGMLAIEKKSRRTNREE
jgi:uncharacterized membrane protein YfhO